MAGEIQMEAALSGAARRGIEAAARIDLALEVHSSELEPELVEAIKGVRTALDSAARNVEAVAEGMRHDA